MKRISLLTAMIATSLLLQGCSSCAQSPTQMANNMINRQTLVSTTNERYPAKNPKRVAFYTNDKTPHTAYRVLGVATISKHNLIGVPRGQQTVNSMMKNLAASIGGDGVMNIDDNGETLRGNVIAFQRILI